MSQSTAAAAVTTLPPCEAPLKWFTGSPAFLAKLHEKIKGTDKKGRHVLTRLTILTGLGGNGKSSMARKYAQVYKDEYGGNVAWINARTNQTIVDSFFSLARHLQICLDIVNAPEDLARTPGNVAYLVQNVYKHFSDHIKKGLFILDNGHRLRTGRETPAIWDYLPKYNLKNYPLFLITSRNQNWGMADQMIRLETWTPELSFEFLQKALHLGQNCGEQLMDRVNKLGNLLGGYPLALNLAVGSITTSLKYKMYEPHQRPEALHKAIGDYMLEFETRSNKWMTNKLPSHSTDPCNHKMDTVWEGSVQSIKNHQDVARAELAIKCLYWMSFLPNECITVELLHFIAMDVTLYEQVYVDYAQLEASDQHEGIKGVNAALKLLENCSMIYIPVHDKPKHRNIWIHRLVQKWTREKLKWDRDFDILQQLTDYFTRNFRFIKPKLMAAVQTYARDEEDSACFESTDWELNPPPYWSCVEPSSNTSADNSENDEQDLTLMIREASNCPEKIQILMEFEEAKRDLQISLARAREDGHRAEAKVNMARERQNAIQADLEFLDKSLRLQLQLFEAAARISSHHNGNPQD